MQRKRNCTMPRWRRCWPIRKPGSSCKPPCRSKSNAGSTRRSLAKPWSGCLQHNPFRKGVVSMTSLRQRMIEDMQIRNLAVHTQNTYVLRVSMFARHFSKSPEVLGQEDIRAYQIYLTNEKKLAITSILIAISALRFLYKITLKKNWVFEE